jgi:transcription elongation factor GreA-like protein
MIFIPILRHLLQLKYNNIFCFINTTKPAATSILRYIYILQYILKLQEDYNIFYKIYYNINTTTSTTLTILHQQYYNIYYNNITMTHSAATILQHLLQQQYSDIHCKINTTKRLQHILQHL